MDHCYPSSSSSSARFEGSQEDNNHDDDNNHNNQDDDHNPTAQMLAVAVEREHMFDKVVTPSDVGKLNRLVIPKQHAEKYFPLDSDRTGSAEPAGSSPSKGLLLNFEDRTGKSWRFRYSYWNSSQSYVMTKGWSRFVKEKKLDAGDIVSFHRAGNKFFIDWRRRPRPDEGAAALLLPPPLLHFSFHRPPPSPGGGGGWFSGGGMIGPGFVVRSSHPYDRDPQYPYHPHQQQQHQGVIWDHLRSRPMLPSVPHPHWIRTTTTTPTPTAANHSSNTVQYHRQVFPPSSSSLQLGDHHHLMVQGEEGGGERMVYDSVPVVQGRTKSIASGKRLRLFGVNMDCPPNNSNSRDSFQLYHDDTIPALSSPSIITSGHDDHRQMVLDDHKEEEEDDQLPLQLSLHVNKGKLSSSSSSMSLDLDM